MMQLVCPFPAARNTATAWAEEHTRQWARQWGLLRDRAAQERFAAACFAELMGRAYPRAHPDLLAVIADWNSWTFLVDTRLDHDELGRDPAALGQFVAAALAIMGERPCPPDPGWPPLLSALHELIGRLRPYTTTAWLRRFRDDVAATLDACVREAHLRGRGLLPDEAQYLALRPHTSGVYCFLDLIELTDSAPLPDALRADPQIERLAALATEAIFLANDLVSADKERLQGDGNNLVLIAERERGLSPQDAGRYVYSRYVQAVGAFLRHRDRLPRLEGELGRRRAHYVTGLEHWMRANLDWSELTGRYRLPAGAAGHAAAREVGEPLYAGVTVRAHEVGGSPRPGGLLSAD